MYENILKIKSIRTEEQLKRLKNLLNYFDLEDAVERYKETETIFDFGLKYAANLSLKIPMEFLLEGIKSYFFGFNEATIFYSSLSVELMLLKASKKLYEKEQSKIKNLTFWWLIHRTNILDQEHIAIADNLRLLRNCYVHLQNEIMYGRIQFDEDRKFLETYKNERMSEQMRGVLVENVRILQRSIEEIFPSLPSVVDKKNIEFMKNRYNLYWKWLEKGKKWTSRTLLDADPREFLRTRMSRFDAFDALKWSESILKFCIRNKWTSNT